MKVKLLTALSGSSGSYVIGDTYDCNNDEAKRLINAGLAVEIQVVKKKTTKK